MNLKLKNYLKISGIMLLIIIIPIFFSTVFFYFNSINSFFNTLIPLISIAISFIYGGAKFSKYDNSKNYISGIKISLGLLFLIIIFNAIFNNIIFDLSNFIYYFVLIIFSIIGSILSSNGKKDNN